jgi:ligand-binding sensor domain-containing protein
MNRCYSVLSFLLIVLSFLQGVPAQGRKTLAGQFEQFSIEHGLSQSSVYCLCQDARGFLWAGTGDGLNRFDGYQFKVFRHTDKTENTISGNRVLALAGDNNGSLWVATERGIDEYVASQGKFFHHDFCNSFRKANQPEYLAALYPEFGDNFVFSNASRIFSYNKKSHTVISTELTGIFAIERYDRQSLLIGTYTAIYQMTVDKRGIYYNRLPIALPKRATIRSMHLDRNGMIWIGTMQDGLFSFAPESGKLQQYAKRIGNFPADHVASITAEDRPVLWIGTNGGGLIRFDAVTGHATNYSTRHSGELSSNFITTLLHDNSGTLWIGTDGGGLNKLYEGRSIFREYKPAGAAAFSFKGKFIRAISLSKDGTLYISALENGLYIIN